MNDRVKAILKQYNISLTRARLLMLDSFLQTTEALTHHHFLINREFNLDRTTIFRTLNLFVNKKILTRITSADGFNRYLVIENKRSIPASFICDICKRIVPAQIIILPKVKLPKGAKVHTMEMLIHGQCSICRKSEREQVLIPG
jgi:Fur family ferric uptake transcriptional regulator